MSLHMSCRWMHTGSFCFLVSYHLLALCCRILLFCCDIMRGGRGGGADRGGGRCRTSPPATPLFGWPLFCLSVVFSALAHLPCKRHLYPSSRLSLPRFNQTCFYIARK